MDTSVLLKIYLDEVGSDEAREVLDSGADLAASAVAQVEMHSAISRRHREGSLSKEEVKRIFTAFEADWFQFGKISADEDILRKAAKLCTQHPLRALDSIHLASALYIQKEKQEPLVFLTSDKRLEKVAHLEKLATHV